MTGLRLLLLVLGILLIAGIYLWSTRFGQRRAAGHGERNVLPDGTVGTPRIAPKADDDLDVATALADLGRLSASEERSATRRLPSRSRGGASARGQATLDFGEAVLDREPLPEVLLSLSVRAREPQVISGAALRAACAELGFEFGAMAIYHHFGIGSTRSPAAVLSLANLFEPGTFDPARMDTFSTPGVVLFMRLPGPLDGQVAFELFLNTAQRLAQRLEADVLGANHTPLMAQDVEALRRTATRYGIGDTR